MLTRVQAKALVGMSVISFIFSSDFLSSLSHLIIENGLVAEVAQAAVIGTPSSDAAFECHWTT